MSLCLIFIKKREFNNETHLPATQHTKEANPWLSCEDEN